MRVAILGCGPTGLVAAHACQRKGVDYQIYSKKRKSFLFGSQYLHESIPGIASAQTWVRYINYGSPEEYRRKTHGKFWDGIVAPEDFEVEHPAWNIREAYDWLWLGYHKRVINYDLDAGWNASRGEGMNNYQMLSYDFDLTQYDLIISSLPRTLWKRPGEEFIYSEGWAIGDAPEQGIFVPEHYVIPDDTIVCDGTAQMLHNRLSNVFGYRSVEWPAVTPEKLISELGCKPSKFVKPLRCKINPDNPTATEQWMHIGRYGEWRKGVVVSDAWNSVNQRLDIML